MTRVALLQTTTGIDPQANAAALVAGIEDAARGGAAMLFTPEMSGLLDRDRQRAAPHVVAEEASPVLAAVREAARANRLWVALGSLAVARDDGRWANRSFVIDDGGAIVARYDKIHMFDVDLAGGESYRESHNFRAGDVPRAGACARYSCSCRFAGDPGVARQGGEPRLPD